MWTFHLQLQRTYIRNKHSLFNWKWHYRESYSQTPPKTNNASLTIERVIRNGLCTSWNLSQALDSKITLRLQPLCGSNPSWTTSFNILISTNWSCVSKSCLNSLFDDSFQIIWIYRFTFKKEFLEFKTMNWFNIWNNSLFGNKNVK